MENSENNVRRCSMTDCFYNEDLECQSVSDLWEPEKLMDCPEYVED